MKRILRAIVVILVIVLIAAACALGTFYFWLNEDTAKATIAKFSSQAFACTPQFDGPVTISRGTSITVGLPAITFVDEKSGHSIGRIDGGTLQVALWPLAIGAVHVMQAEIRSPELYLDLPGLEGEKVFQGGFGRAHFPSGLKVENVRFLDGKVGVRLGTAQQERFYELSGLSLALGEFSPEMTTGMAFNANIRKLAGKPAAWPTSQETDQTNATQAFSTPTSSTSTQAPVQNEKDNYAGTAAAVGLPGAVQAVQDAQSVIEKEVRSEKHMETKAPQEAPESSSIVHAPQTEAVDPQIPAQEKELADMKAAVTQEVAADENKEAPAAMPATHKSATSKNAVPALPDSLAQRWENWRLSELSGSVSLRGTMALSTSQKELTFSSADGSAELQINGQPWSPVIRIGTLTFKKGEITGSGIDLSLASNQEADIDYHVGLASFQLAADTFSSPETRLSYSVATAAHQSTLEATSSVQADWVAKTVKLDNFSSRYSLTGAQKEPFVVQVQGWVNGNPAANTAQMSISGSIATSTFTYNGTWKQLTDRPTLDGELTLAAIDLTAPAPTHAREWLNAVDFAGDLRIANLAAGKTFGSQLHTKATLQHGALSFTDAILTVADGRILGSAQAAADGSWKAQGRIDGVDLEKLAADVAGASPIKGTATGGWELSGHGNDVSALQGSGRVRVIRGAYKGLDLAAGRVAVLSEANPQAIVNPQAVTNMDETSLRFSVSGSKIALSDLVSRSVFLRCSADLTLDAATGTVAGKASVYYAPQSGAPSVTLSAALSGEAKAPTWTFDVADAKAALHGTAAAPQPEQPKKQDKSLWQRAKEFFSF